MSLNGERVGEVWSPGGWIGLAVDDGIRNDGNEDEEVHQE